MFEWLIDISEWHMPFVLAALWLGVGVVVYMFQRDRRRKREATLAAERETERQLEDDLNARSDAPSPPESR